MRAGCCALCFCLWLTCPAKEQSTDERSRQDNDRKGQDGPQGGKPHEEATDGSSDQTVIQAALPFPHQPAWLHLLQREDGLTLVFHLPCQATEPGDGLFWSIPGFSFSTPQHPLRICGKDLGFSSFSGTSTLDLLERGVLIGQNQHREHQRRCRQFLQDRITLKSGTQCCYLLTETDQVVIDLLVGKLLNCDGTAERQRGRLPQILIHATTHHKRNDTMCSMILIDCLHASRTRGRI